MRRLTLRLPRLLQRGISECFAMKGFWPAYSLFRCLHSPLHSCHAPSQDWRRGRTPERCCRCLSFPWCQHASLQMVNQAADGQNGNVGPCRSVDQALRALARRCMAPINACKQRTQRRAISEQASHPHSTYYAVQSSMKQSARRRRRACWKAGQLAAISDEGRCILAAGGKCAVCRE